MSWFTPLKRRAAEFKRRIEAMERRRPLNDRARHNLPAAMILPVRFFPHLHVRDGIVSFFEISDFGDGVVGRVVDAAQPESSPADPRVTPLVIEKIEARPALDEWYPDRRLHARDRRRNNKSSSAPDRRVWRTGVVELAALVRGQFPR